MLLDDGRQLLGHTAGGQGEVAVEIEVQRGVHEHRDEPGPGRRLLGLGPATILLALEAEAGGDADNVPTTVEQMEERTGAADGLVVGVRGDVHERGCHEEGG